MTASRFGEAQSGGRIRGLLPLITLLLVPITTLVLGPVILPTSIALAKEHSEATTHIVEIRQFKFYPATLRVKRGDTIVWKNIDAAPHTATSGQWDSGRLNRNQSWSFKVTSKGSIEYICAFHPMMKGKIIVD